MLQEINLSILTLRIIEERKKEKEEREEKELEEFVNLILNVFEASNEEQKETEDRVLIWKVIIRRVAIDSGNEVRSKVICSINFSPNANEESNYLKKSVFLENMKKVCNAMEKVEDKEISKVIFDTIYDYFINVSGYKAAQTGDVITITMLKD